MSDVCKCGSKKHFDCGRSDDEHIISDLSNDFLIVLGILDRNTKDGPPQEMDTGECYFCERGLPREDGDEDELDHLESPGGHKPECAWRQARELFDLKKVQDALGA